MDTIHTISIHIPLHCILYIASLKFKAIPNATWKSRTDQWIEYIQMQWIPFAFSLFRSFSRETLVQSAFR